MNLAQNIDPTGHRGLQTNTARYRHARGCNRRCLGPVIHRRDQRGFQQLGLTLAGHIAAQHQPYHLRKTRIADQISNGLPANVNPLGFYIDDACLPPIREWVVFVHFLFKCL